MLLSIAVFLLVLGVLVFLHELGHFAVAKWVGMKVDEFAIGFPPRLFARKKGETTYAINALPLGGYVKIHGETLDPEDKDPRSFQAKSVWARMAVIMAGVTMNILFALVVMSVAFSIGFPASGLGLEKIPGAEIKKSEILVANTLSGSPAEKAGIKGGDLLVSLQAEGENQPTYISNATQLHLYSEARQEAGQLEVIAQVKQGEEVHSLPLSLNGEGPALGANIQELVEVKVPFWRAPEAAGKAVYYIVANTWDALAGFVTKIFSQGELDPTVSGPVGIYKVTAAAAEQGVVPVVFLMVILSVNLALLNVMPIPALDGGKMVFLILEAVFRKRVISEKIEAAVGSIGFLFLIGLIFVISLRDIGLF